MFMTRSKEDLKQMPFSTPHTREMTKSLAASVSNEDESSREFSAFDELIASMDVWSDSLLQWPPAAAVRAAWSEVHDRLASASREQSRMLVVGIVGGTGTGKSTLVNALACRNVSTAGDQMRPTTVHPVVIAPERADLSWLPLQEINARVVNSDAESISQIILIDCPDPDTQPTITSSPTHVVRPSDSNQNRQLLEKVLPLCDVLFLVSTAQKYRSWVVAKELAAFAPGRPMLFVQTHASRDPDIREDWKRELVSQGFSVPIIFRLDAVEANRRHAVGEQPDQGFQEILDAISFELNQRGARRVRRTGSLDLAGWFLRSVRSSLEDVREPVAALASGIRLQRQSLESQMARAIGTELVSCRSAWQQVLVTDVLQQWQGGPFSMFLHAIVAIGSLWPRLASLPGGMVSRMLTNSRGVRMVTTVPQWHSIAEIGISQAAVERSRSILSGMAARAAIHEPLVGRVKFENSRESDTIAGLLGRTDAWLSTGVQRLLSTRRAEVAGQGFRLIFELLFSGMVACVLGRAAWGFFYGQLWLGQSSEGTGFLQESLVWMILWGLVLRWLVLMRLRIGLNRDIDQLVQTLSQARPTDPLLADFEEAAIRTSEFIARGDAIEAEWSAISLRLTEHLGPLGRLTEEAACDRLRNS